MVAYFLTILGLTGQFFIFCWLRSFIQLQLAGGSKGVKCPRWFCITQLQLMLTVNLAVKLINIFKIIKYTEGYCIGYMQILCHL